MKKYNANVIVNLKKGVRDPQGTAVDTVLRRIGLEDSSQVKVGKFFTLSLTANSETEAREKLNKICNDVLSNPVLESYEVERFLEV